MPFASSTSSGINFLDATVSDKADAHTNSVSINENQTIIDLINMNAGDYKYINDEGVVKDYSYDVDTNSISATMNKFFRIQRRPSQNIITLN